ncbi:tyrosine-protein kinase STYK1 isoform X2 [Antennarius striatus]|uniref:tyrosine-protein kinase STYK1 isoform X2 n=1 Tax=Antennarius striatus TaxID=241820 RepID=UPI0035B1894E
MPAGPPGCVNDSSLPTCYDESSGHLAVIIIPSLLALSTVLVVALIFYSLYKNQNRVQRSVTHFINAQQSVSTIETCGHTPKFRTALGPWEIPEDCVLGEVKFWQKGRYGPICKDGTNQPEAKEFVGWVQFHATVCKHDNVVRMLCCQTKRLPMYMVLEACSPGNLLHFLWTLRNRNSNTADPFSEMSVFLVAKQVAAGLDYLMSNHRLVHGDVAARNVLIGPGLSARMSGLGLAFSGRRVYSALKHRAAEVPLKWKAPERVLVQLSIDRSDVWSFGILLYELITLGSPPYPELEPLDVLPKLQGSYRMERPENCGVPLYDLMRYCWMWSFKDRPTFSSIIKLLESSIHRAATEAICVPEVMDMWEYNRQAGLL